MFPSDSMKTNDADEPEPKGKEAPDDPSRAPESGGHRPENEAAEEDENFPAEPHRASEAAGEDFS